MRYLESSKFFLAIFRKSSKFAGAARTAFFRGLSRFAIKASALRWLGPIVALWPAVIYRLVCRELRGRNFNLFASDFIRAAAAPGCIKQMCAGSINKQMCAGCRK